jgi:hypothetical protein
LEVGGFFGGRIKLEGEIFTFVWVWDRLEGIKYNNFFVCADKYSEIFLFLVYGGC